MTTIRFLTAPPPGSVLGAEPDVTESAEAYRATGGYDGATGPDELLRHLEASALRGRGGAGFPAAVKLRAVREGGGAPVVVANGEEGEPGSVKDRWLLRARPHLVLDGLVRAAAVTGAVRGYVYLSDPEAGARVRRALAEREPPLPIEVVETAHSYVAGEESAIVRRIDGGPALPTAKPPRPFERGVGGAPTLVSNVETLARIALTAARPGLRRRIARSTLVTLSGPAGDPLLTEVPYGVPLRTLAAAHGAPDAAGALMGGLFGGLVDARGLDLPLEPGALAAAGTALGCGAIRFLPAGACPVSAAAEAVGHLAAESARQCGVCVTGTAAVHDALRSLAAGTAGPDTLANLTRWSRGLPGRGACGLLDAAAGTAGSLLRAFPDLLPSHLGAVCPGCAADPPSGGPGRLAVAVPEVTDAAASSARIPLPALKGTP
ncbi:NADH-ubiquinone oxidoreductase-F iron-sulfur binding region domain-containing protein [Streptomyces sp. NBC_01565]|uniref:NADH-ubiquinone oxidoreductase-F iron-sulfur binding region domain-containing protein n=1 Tax=unclassified Streptomyces TaxID=2593676 RepID=UPI002254073F|nr:NADH-ubiquinone oxidoreductase-F iron-sulfur binding region domain-containing protein [Streptomyces sp. NBC_01565]MCX4539416.1 Fe-S-binding domain-containing protein [Streptomyces sp. NBC_01565]